jgi:cytochrome b6-f complex iron-sulfur subunit
MTESFSNPRRLFLKTWFALLCAIAFWLMSSLARRTAAVPENAEAMVTIPLPAGTGFRFYDKVIVVFGFGKLAVFSSTCPHLGCRINRAEGSEIVCPCHGSRFNVQGEVLRGPAKRGLQPLQFELDRSQGTLRVRLERH